MMVGCGIAKAETATEIADLRRLEIHRDRRFERSQCIHDFTSLAVEKKGYGRPM